MSAVHLEQYDASVTFRIDEHFLRIWFVTPNVARITMTGPQGFLQRKSRIVIAEPEQVPFGIETTPEYYVLRTSALIVSVSKHTGALSYFDATGTLLVKEPKSGGKQITKKNVTRNIFEQTPTVAVSESTDGVRAAAQPFKTVFDREAYEAQLTFVFAEEEAIFGFGSHEEGFANLRGHSRDLYQHNMKAVVPVLTSTRGYSVLFDCMSLMTFRDDDHGGHWWADCVDELDYYVIHGHTFDDRIRSYRALTGAVPLPPKWAFGYVQSKERYVTADEMLEVVREYRRRKVPLDLIVLDWKSWPNDGGWGQKSFDLDRFPEPSKWIEALHALGAKLMISIWPIMTGGCNDQKELVERGLMLGNNSTYNAFSEEARQCYWEQAEQGLFSHGVDAWWCDCTEPFESDWKGAIRPSPLERLTINTSESKLYLDDAEINAYSLLHSQGIYQHQRQRDKSKRVLNLTRSSYAGQSRYGTFTWNGDICATWEALRISIAEGLNFCATGEPYWTVDAGGFFLASKPDLWFWRGDYDANTRGLTSMQALEPDAKDTGCTDLGFHELYTRWMQYAAFLPMMRSHGTDAAREIWRFGEKGSPFYDAIEQAIHLRYRMLPYIYSVAAAVTFSGASMMTPLALVYPQDQRTHNIADQYMFGTAMMVCPVTQPMLFGRNSVTLASVPQSREVYLPDNFRWYDFWSEQLHDGAQLIEVPTPIDRIPLFIREGSILVLGQVMRFADEIDDAPYEIHVYTGIDAEFFLHEDDGGSYNYEEGSCSRTHILWNESQHTLSFIERSGAFVGMVAEREFRVTLHTPAGLRTQTFQYSGVPHTCLFS